MSGILNRETTGVVPTALCGILLLFLLVSKIFYFNDYFTCYGGESSRDYLVARHIATGTHLPLVGPPNAASQNLLVNSPFYFYFLAALVFIGRSFIFLNACSVFLWLFAVWCVYQTGRLFFSPASGLIAALLFGLHPIFWYRSTFLWQPDIAASVLMVSVWLLALAHQKQQMGYLFLSVVFVAVAAILHNAVFPLAAPLTLVALWLCWRWRKSFLTCGRLVAVQLFVFLVSYAPVLWFLHMQEPQVRAQNAPSIVSLITFTAARVFDKFYREGLGLFESFFYFLSAFDPWLPRVLPVITVGSLAVLVGALWYGFGKRTAVQKFAYFFLLFLVALQVGSVSVLRVGGGFQYLAPAYGLLALFISETLVSWWGQGWIVKVGVLAICAQVITVPFVFSVVRLNDNFSSSFLNAPSVRQVVGDGDQGCEVSASCLRVSWPF